ncbi:MAG TPA: hypothetical protein VJ901_00115 [Thermoanaerobaculia bacterium]|nr:hypothetical protein [Thermoanaerobaculia bacterium]
MRWWCAILLLVASFGAVADDHRDVPRPRRPHASSQHDGFSPFPPPPAEDTLFTVDSGGDLDTDCTYHSGGPLVIHLPVTRFAGPVSSNGTLQNSAQLVANGYLSESAHLRMPAYDVDVFGDPDVPTKAPEVDRVYFNGHEVGLLTGDNEIWKLNEFEVPIEWVKFPSIGSDGTLPAAADNVIAIDIDTASGGDDNWCTSVDWVELDFGAIAPIFLVHGILSSGPEAWPNFHSTLAAAGAPFSDEINLSGTGSIEGNAAILATRLPALAAKFGAKKCHIVAHSKGGLDTRAFLDGEYDGQELKVLSLYTLSTPHHGSVLADIALGLTTAIAGGPATLLIAQQVPMGPDLTVTSSVVFNLRHRSVPGGIRVYTYGGDADLNGNGSLDANEAAELPLSPALASVSWGIIRNELPVKVTFGTQTIHVWGNVSFSLVDIDVSRNFTKNDVFVSANSAVAPFGTYLGTRGANHTTIKSSDLASVILRNIVADYPNR